MVGPWGFLVEVEFGARNKLFSANYDHVYPGLYLRHDLLHVENQ
jgi:hypothetical protein